MACGTERVRYSQKEREKAKKRYRIEKREQGGSIGSILDRESGRKRYIEREKTKTDTCGRENEP